MEKLGGAGLCLLSLLGGQLLVIYLLQAQLTQALFSRPEFLYLQVLPGLVWPLVAAWLFSAWQARRHPGVTALPFGYSLGLATLLTTSLMVPMYQQAIAKMSPEKACSLTWSACVALTLVVGLCQILLAPFAHRLTFRLSLPLCLGLGAAVAVQSLSGLLPWLLEHPLLAMAGLVPLIAYLVVGLPRPFGLSAGWLVLGTGVAAEIFSGTSFEVPDFQSTLLPNWQLGWIEEGLQFLWLRTELLTVALPVLIAALVRDLVLLREAQAYPNAPAARNSLLGLGCINVLGACLGCGLPLAVLPGYLGYRRWGGGQFYCQGAGLLLVLFSLLGGFGQFFAWVPLPTLGIVLSALLIASAGLGLNQIRQPNGVLPASCWLPFLAAANSGSPLLLGLVWGGIAVCVQEERFSRAALVALLGSLLTATGILHGNLWNPDFDPLAGTYLVLAILLRVGHVAPIIAPKPPQPPASESPSDSSGSPGTKAFDSPADSPSAGDAELEPSASAEPSEAENPLP